MAPDGSRIEADPPSVALKASVLEGMADNKQVRLPGASRAGGQDAVDRVDQSSDGGSSQIHRLASSIAKSLSRYSK